MNEKTTVHFRGLLLNWSYDQTNQKKAAQLYNVFDDTKLDCDNLIIYNKIMKKIILAKLLMAIFMLTLIGCSEEVYRVEHFNGENKNKISLSQFKKETKIKDFDIFFKMPVSSNSAMNRTVDISEFLIDTVAIQKHISENNKTTYSFRVYTLVLGAQMDEKYNLVYTKENNAWEKSIVAFKEKLQATETENQLESFEKLYDSRFANTMSSYSEVCFNELYYVQCDGSCAREGYGQCDGFGCPTGQCVQHTVTVGFCGGQGVGPTNPGGPTYPGSAGNLNPFEFTPNLFENPAFDDPNYINSVRTQYFFDHLDYSAQVWVNSHVEDYVSITRYLSQNNWSRTVEESLSQLIGVCVSNNASFTIDNLGTADNSLVFNNPNEFNNYLNNRDLNGTDFTVELQNPNQKIVSTKFWTGAPFNGIKVNINQNLSPNYSVTNVTSELYGVTLLVDWEQSDYSSSISNNIVTVDVYGVASIKLFYQHIGTIYHENQHFQIKINRLTGEIISAVKIP